MLDLDDPSDTDDALEREWRWPRGLVAFLSELARRHVSSRDTFCRAAMLELALRGVPMNVDSAARLVTIHDFERERMRRAARRASVGRYLA